MGTASYAYNEAKMMDGIKAFREEQKVRPEIKNRDEELVIVERNDSRELLERVAERLATTPEAVISGRRLAHLVRSRQIMIFILRRGHQYSLTRIGRILNMHHTSVMHMEYKAAKLYQDRPSFRDVVDELAKTKIDVPRDDLGIPL